MSKRRHYTVAEVLDEVFADSDNDFDPDITDANDENGEISVSDSSSRGTCGGLV